MDSLWIDSLVFINSPDDLKIFESLETFLDLDKLNFLSLLLTIDFYLLDELYLLGSLELLFDCDESPPVLAARLLVLVCGDSKRLAQFVDARIDVKNGLCTILTVFTSLDQSDAQIEQYLATLIVELIRFFGTILHLLEVFKLFEAFRLL